MRKSVATKKANQKREAQKKADNHKRLALWLSVLLVASLTLLFLSYLNWIIHNKEQAQSQQLALDQQEMARLREQAKVNAAKKAEA